MMLAAIFFGILFSSVVGKANGEFVCEKSMCNDTSLYRTNPPRQLCWLSLTCGTEPYLLRIEFLTLINRTKYSCCDVNVITKTICYHLCCKEDCVLGEWMAWSDCEGTCGGGNGTQTRSKKVVTESQCGGRECQENEKRETKVCTTGCCKKDCYLTPWSEWSVCSNTCGKGFREQTRKRIRAECGGEDCSATAMIERSEDCVLKLNQNCTVSEWGAWGSCVLNSGTCGPGKETRTRTVVKPQNCEGEKCPDLSETRECTGPCCVTHCELGQWSRWQAWTTDCGNATRQRSRTEAVKASCGGRSCEGDRIESAHSVFNSLKNCVVTEWGEWSECSSGCGSGQRTRRRNVTQENTCGGAKCPDNLVENIVCTSIRDRRDCKLSQWGDWTTCYFDCTGHTRNRSRTIEQEPLCGGVACENTFEKQSCNETCAQKCRNRKCSCRPGFYANGYDCKRVSCIGKPYPGYAPPGYIFMETYRNPVFKCDKFKYEDRCYATCPYDGWSVIGDLPYSICTYTRQWSNEKIFCGKKNNKPRNITLSKSKFAETEKAGFCLGRLLTVDDDFNSHVYTLMSNIDDRLKIETNQLCLKKQVNFEKVEPVWVVTIRSTDQGGEFLEKNFTMEVLNSNDPPVFKIDRELKVPERSASDTLIAYFTVEDEDTGSAGDIEITLVNDDQGRFRMETMTTNASSVITYKLMVSSGVTSSCVERGGPTCKLNFEKQATRKISLKIFDKKPPSLMEYRDMEIKLTDENDAPTGVKAEPPSLPESTATGTKFSKLVAVDEDSAQSWEYSLQNGSSKFVRLEGTDLVLTNLLNYENKEQRQLSLRIKVKDNGEPPMEGVFDITIAVTDSNDKPVIVEPNMSNLTIEENKPIGAQIATVRFEDQDAGENISCIVTSTNKVVRCRLLHCISEGTTMQKTVCSAVLETTKMLNFESQNKFSVTLKALDKADASVTREYTLEVVDTNDKPTKILFDGRDISVVYVDEESPGKRIAQLSAVDEDGERFKFRLVRDPSGLLDIKENSLKLRDGVEFDFEGTGETSFNITIQVEDYGTPVESYFQDVVVEVRNLNENPRCVKISSDTVSENAVAGTVVGRLSSCDPDRSQSHVFTLTSDIHSAFAIRGAVLEVADSSSISFKDTPSVTIGVQCTDNGTPPMSVTGTLTISLTDANDVPTEILLSATSLPENLDVGAVVATITVSDPDQGQTATITISQNDVLEIKETTNLVLKSKVDYEKTSEVEVTLTATDSGTPPLSLTSNFTLKVINAPEPPFFLAESTEGTISISVPESARVSSVVGTTFVGDGDSGDTLSIAADSSTTGVPVSGNVTECGADVVGESLKARCSGITCCRVDFILEKTLNFEGQRLYSIALSVSDQTNAQVSTNLLLSVSDVPEPPTEILLGGTSMPAVIKVKENEGKVLGVLSARDQDGESTLNFSSTKPLIVDGNELKVERLNYEATSSYQCQIEVEDVEANQNLTKMVTVEVENVNEKPFNLKLTANTIAENSKAGAEIGYLSASDPDNIGNSTVQSLTFALVDDARGNFAINGTILSVASGVSLNFERQKSYSIIVRATDNGTPAASVEKAFEIVVIDVNDAPTEMRLSKTSFAASAAAGTMIGELSVVDEDKDEKFDFLLLSAIPEGTVALDVEGRFSKVSSDVLSDQTINVSVRATDKRSSGQLFLVSSFTLRAETALFSTTFADGALKVDENKEAGTKINTLAVTLPVGAASATVSNNSVLTFGPGSCGTASPVVCSFTVHTARKFDFEKSSSVPAEISIKTNNDKQTSVSTTLQIADVSEAPMEVHFSPSAPTIPENSVGDRVVTVSANDEDEGDTLRFGLLSHQDFLAIDSNGRVKVVKGFDFETDSSFVLSVNVTDSTGLFTQGSVNVTVLDINEPVVKLIISNETVPENSIDGTEVGFFTVTDPEKDQNHTFKLKSDGQGRFRINGNKLEVARNEVKCKTTKEGCSLNFEKEKEYTLVVEVTDSGTPSTVKDFSIKINVNDVNDSPTVILLSFSSVKENAVIGTVVGTLSVGDEDKGDSHDCAVVGDQADTFRVSDMKLETKRELNFETKASWSVVVECSDRAGVKVNRTFTVQVTNINEAPRDITTDLKVASKVLTVAENSAARTQIGKIYALDPDASDSLRIECLSSVIRCAEVVCKNEKELMCSSNVTVMNSTALDYETNSAITFRAIFTDTGGLKASANITLTIIDIDEPPNGLELLNPPMTVVNVLENAKNIRIADVKVIDPDATADSYEITVNDKNFVVQGQALWLSGSANFDYEGENQPQSLTITANGTQFSINRTFPIVIKDVNEKPISIEFTTCEIPENHPVGSNIGTVKTFDPDRGQRFSYTLLTHTDRFAIDNGMLKHIGAKPFNFEEKASYDLRITSTDNGNPPISITQDKTLSILNVNEAPIDIIISGLVVPENVGIETLVGEISVSDPDKIDTFTVSVSGTEVLSVKNNKELVTAGAIDFETGKEIAFDLTAEDSGSPPLKMSKNFTLKVENVNELPVIAFLDGTGATVNDFTIFENTTIGARIGTFEVRDPDVGDDETVTATGAHIQLRRRRRRAVVTGTVIRYDLLNNEKLDHETAPVHTVKVVAKDKTGLSTTATVKINVANSNDDPISVTLEGSPADVIENVVGPQNLGTFRVVDPDKEDTHSFTLDGPSSVLEKLEVKNETLMLRSGQSFDYENGSEWTVSVRAQDEEGLSVTGQFMVRVIDANERPVVTSFSATKPDTIPSWVTTNLEVGRAMVRDVDKDQTFTLDVTGDKDDFLTAVVNNSVAIVKAVRNHCVMSSYLNLTLIATDNGEPAKTSLPFKVSLKVEPSDKEPKDFVCDTKSKVTEGQANVIVGNCSLRGRCTKKVLSKIPLRINSSNPDITFTPSGEAKLVTAADYETKRELKTNVVATWDGRSAERTILIDVDDFDEPPTDIRLLGDQTVTEHTAVGSLIGTLTAQDPEDRGRIAFTVVSVADGNTEVTSGKPVFEVDGASLVVGPDGPKEIDFAKHRAFTLTIKATDNSGQSSSKAVTITVINVNEGPTGVQLIPADVTIAEDAEIGKELAIIKVQDPDPGDKHSCVSSSNILKVVDEKLILNKALDFEESKEVTSKITCTDSGGLNASATVLVTVTNVDEPPEITGPTPAAVWENATVGTNISKLTVSDPEGQTTSVKLLSCSPGPECPVKLVGDQIQLESALTGKTFGTIMLTVEAKDLGSKTKTQEVKLAILRFSNPKLTFLATTTPMKEKGKLPRVVGSVNVSGADNIKLLCKITRYERIFRLNATASQNSFELVAYADTDFESTPQLTAEVSCYRNEFQRLGKTDIKITVVNVNEAPSEMILVFPNEGVQEGQKIIGTLTVTDPDSGDIISCSTTEKNIVIECRGTQKCRKFQVSVQTPFDYESTKKFDLTITCSDSKGLSKTKSFEVPIVDVNEAPISIRYIGTTDIELETVEENQIIGTFLVDDPDVGQAHQIEVLNGSNYFQIKSGNKLAVRDLKFADPQSLRIAVRAMDNGRSPLSLNATFNFRFLLPKGTIFLSPKVINQGSTGKTLIGNLQYLVGGAVYSKIKYEIQNVPSKMFAFEGSKLYLLVPAEELASAAYTATVVVRSSMNDRVLASKTVDLTVADFLSCRGVVCRENAHCVAENPKIKGTCQCNDGFVQEGEDCVRKNDPCQPNPCKNKGACRVESANFQCVCKSGFKGKLCENSGASLTASLIAVVISVIVQIAVRDSRL